MAFARRLGVVSILGACWFAAVACADDEDRKDTSEDGGEGGDEGGGKGGTPSLGGSSTNAGKAGMSGGGKAGSSAAGEGGGGTAGDAGSGFGGDAGSGSGGDSGSGGSMGGAGGEPTSGGEGGLSSGGAGGEGGAPVAVAQSCVDVCEDDDDCTDVDGFPKKCNEVSKLCESCSVDADCAPEQSQWFTGCETTDDCFDPLFACVDYRGNTYCAVVDDPQNGAGCADLGEFEATTATLHEGGAEISVCVTPYARCFDGNCDVSCETFDACPVKQGDTCNPVSGKCECQNSTECGDGLVCVDNLCTECATDDDCLATAGLTGLDTCVAGRCGCTDVGSCTSGKYPAATNACQ